MVEFDSNASHADIAHEIVQRLTESSPHFPFVQIADMCFSSGLINARERAELTWKTQFPNWLLKELYNALPQHMELTGLTSKTHEMLSLCEARNLAVTEPVALSVSGYHPKTRKLTSKYIKTPEMLATRGNVATHYVHPRLNISWSTEDGVIGPRTDRSARFILNFLHDLEPNYLPGRTFLGVVKAGRDNYLHWLRDTFSRLLALIETGIDLNEFDQFVFLNDKHNFQKETLKGLGIGPERIITSNLQGSLFKTDEFAFVSDPCIDYVTSANVFEMIRSFFGQQSDNRHGHRKIYISRSKASKRRILNEDEVVHFLEPLGYECISFEDISIQETARIMAETEAVIAPHGAGLINIIFTAPGTKVLELFNVRYSFTYWMAANQRNLNYYAFEACGPDGEKLDPAKFENLSNYNRKTMDMTIPMKCFKDFVINEFEREKK